MATAVTEFERRSSFWQKSCGPLPSEPHTRTAARVASARRAWRWNTASRPSSSSIFSDSCRPKNMWTGAVPTNFCGARPDIISQLQ
jgi:hypothetical protein